MEENQQKKPSTPDGTFNAQQPVAPGPGLGGQAGQGGAPKSNMMKIVAVAVVVVLIVAAGGAWMLMGKKDTATDTANKQPANAPKVKVGFMMAQTGGAASMGLGAFKGVELAKKQLGADNIEIVQADSKCDAEAAKTAIQKLIDEKVVAIIGEGCSSASVAVLPLANEAKIPMVTPSASSPKLSIENDYFFRTVPSDSFQARYLAEYAYNKKGFRRIAQFNTTDTAGSSFASIFQQRFEELGGKIVGTATAESHIIELGTQAKTLAATKPEAITIFANTVNSAVAFINLIDKEGYQGDYFGSDALYDTTLITQTGKASDQRLIVSNFALGTKAFKQSMANAYQSTELAYAAAQAYDALHAIQAAVQTGADTGEEVKNAFSKVDFQGVGGYRIKFDKYGEISDDVKYSLLQVQGGTFKEVEQ